MGNYSPRILSGLLLSGFISITSVTSAQQFYGHTFQYELKSNDSLYLDLVLFVDCTADTSFTPDSIKLSGNNDTHRYQPRFQSRKDVTPLGSAAKSYCEDPNSSIVNRV